MFKLKKEKVLEVDKALEKEQKYEDACKTDKNTNECLVISEIRNLQERKDILQEELTKIETEIFDFNIPIYKNYDYCSLMTLYDTTIIEGESYLTLNQLKISTSEKIYDISSKLNKLAKMKERPEDIQNEIEQIECDIVKLKEQLGIK